MQRWQGSWRDWSVNPGLPAATDDRPVKSRQPRHLCKVARRQNQRSCCSSAYLQSQALARPSSTIQPLSVAQHHADSSDACSGRHAVPGRGYGFLEELVGVPSVWGSGNASWLFAEPTSGLGKQVTAAYGLWRHCTGLL